MVVELRDQTQPDIIVKNMQGISEENAESINKAKKLIVDYSEAFKKEEEQGTEVESAFAKAQGLLHAADPNADISVKIEAVLPAIDAVKQEAVLFAFAVLCEAKDNPAEGKTPNVTIETDGLSITVHAHGLAPTYRDRLKNLEGPQIQLVRGFAVDRCQGKCELTEDDGALVLSLTLKAKM